VKKSLINYLIDNAKSMITRNDQVHQEEQIQDDNRCTNLLQERRDYEEKQARIKEIQMKIADIFLDTEKEAKKAIRDPDMKDVIEVTRELARDLIEEYNLLTK
jgi:hypothetical protein